MNVRAGRFTPLSETYLAGVIAKALLVERLIQSMPLGDAISEYLTDLRLENRSPRTIEFYATNLAHLTAFLPQVRVEDLTASEMRQFLASRDPTHQQAMDAHYRALRAFFNWAVKQRYLVENPITQLKRPKVPIKVIPTFTIEDIKGMLQTHTTDTFLGRRNRAIVLVLFDTGIRASELLKLRLADVDIEHGLLRVQGKGNKERIVAMSRRTVKELWGYLKNRGSREDSLFLSEERHPLTYEGMSGAIKKMGRKAGVTGTRVSPHTFRHTFAVMFLRSGGNIRDLQTLGGWETLDMVIHYTQHLKEQDALEAHQMHSPVDRFL